jgi:LysM repeat protein
MALRELSEVMPEPAADLSADQALLDQLLNYEKAETGEGEQGFDLGATDPPSDAADQDETYVVQQGDTLNKISQDLGIPLEDLAKQNQITDVNLINPGQEIKYKKPGAAPAEPGEIITLQEGGTKEEGVLGAPPETAPGDEISDAGTSTTAGDEAKVDFTDEPVVAEADIDAPPVTEEEIIEEPGGPVDLETQSKESAIQVAKNVGTALSPDTKEVYDDVIQKIEDMDITPTEGVEEYYNKLANNINDRIEDYNINISTIASEQRKPTFEGWNKVLAVLGAAMGAYGSAMTGTPNYAQKIIDNAIDRDTQAFLKSKEIRTKALSEQRMDLIMRRGELLQMAQNRVTH